MQSSTDTQRMLNIARLYLTTFDEDGLRRYCGGIGVQALQDMLSGEDHDAAKVAAVGLGLLQHEPSVPELTAALTHRDAVVCAMAEYALWTIWFGQKGEHCETQLRKAAFLPYAEAVKVLNRLVHEHPEWAEALNQRAIVHFRNRCFVSALDDCKEALEINPQHFGALAGLAHTYAQLGLYGAAEECYREALDLHPRMHGIRQSLQAIRKLVSASQAG